MQAGQVWFPDSALKTAHAMEEYDREGLPLFIMANWRGFSGGQRDLLEGVLPVCTSPFYIYGLLRHTLCKPGLCNSELWQLSWKLKACRRGSKSFYIPPLLVHCLKEWRTDLALKVKC